MLLPKNNRQLLWARTQTFFYRYPSTRSIWQRTEELEPYQAVLLIYEAVWILEHCLIPLQTDQADVIRSLIEKLNPFPEALELGSAELDATLQNQVLSWEGNTVSWREIADAWTHLGFALLRLARQDLDTEAFGFWHSHLAPLSNLRKEWAARLSHEAVQYHLVRLEENRVRQHLQDWLETPDMPEWTLRKAGAFAEFGDLEKAKGLATSAVAHVRRGLQEEQENIYLLSLESWALDSLQLYAQGISFIRSGDEAVREQMEFERTSYRERLEALKPYRCDPHTERSQLELQVRGLKPELHLDGERVEERRGFDPGTRRVTRRIGSGSDFFINALPGFALLEVSSETGYPIHSPNLNTLEGIERAAEWIWPLSPLWAISAYLRAGKKEERERWLTRARIASLSDEHVSTLTEMLTNAGRTTLSALGVADIPRLSYAHSVLPGILEVLSKLCFRLYGTQIDEVVELALESYEASAIQRDYSYWNPLNVLFNRALTALTPEKRLAWLPRLMNLPFPPEVEEGSPHFQPQRPEPSVFLHPNELPKINEENEVWTQLQRSIPILLEHVRRGGIQARWSAIWRLMRLYEIEALLPDQQEHFAEAIWSRLDTSGLPEATNTSYNSILYLPEPEPGRAESTLRAFLTNKDVVPVVTRLEEGGFTSNGGYDGNMTLEAWLAVTLLPKEDKSPIVGIDWASADVEKLLTKLLKWSQEELSPDSYSFRFIESDLQDRLLRIEYCLAEIIYPRASELSDQGRRDLEEFDSRLKSFNFNPIISLPASLCFIGGKEQVEDIESRLRTSLSSCELEIVRRALEAIHSWTRLADLDLISPVPEGLLRELGNKILMRRDPELIYGLEIMSSVMSKFPGVLPNGLRRDLLQALEHLLPEVELPTLMSIDAVSKQRQVFTIDERPDAFAAAAKLAALLHRELISKGKAIPDILEAWRLKATESVLPEVRLAFRASNDTQDLGPEGGDVQEN